MELQLTPTDSSLNEKQPNAKRKQTNQPDSEEVVSTIDETTNQDTVMEDQEIYNPTQTRTSARPSTPATKDNNKRVSYLLKRPCFDKEKHGNGIRQ